MLSKSILLLTALLQALTVRYNTSWEELEGQIAFVRFATVVKALPNMVFQEGDEVALKIGFEGSEKEMEREQGAHAFIRDNAPEEKIDGVVQAEVALGLSSDFTGDLNFVMPLNMSLATGDSLVLITKRQGKNLACIYDNRHEFEEEEALSIHTKLMEILGRLKDIKFVHGDIRPENIVLVSGDNLKGPICLVNLRLAVYEGSDVECAGTGMYASPAQLITARSVTYEDCVISGAYVVAYLFTEYLPWIDMLLDSKNEKPLHNNHAERMLLSKIEFNANPFDNYPNQNKVHYAPIFRQALTQTIQNAIAQDQAANEAVANFYKVCKSAS